MPDLPFQTYTYERTHADTSPVIERLQRGRHCATVSLRNPFSFQPKLQLFTRARNRHDRLVGIYEHDATTVRDL